MIDNSGVIQNENSIGKIKLIRVKDYKEMSKTAGEIISSLISSKPNATLGLATGSTPIGLYQYLISEYKSKKISFENIKTFNLDEYCGLPITHNQSYYYFMHDNFFDHININKSNINMPNGEGVDLQKNCGDYNKKLTEAKIDLQLLGIGANGHIGFNEPGTDFDSTVHIVNLSEKTIKDNSRFFEGDVSKVPKQAITMGLKNILQAKKIVLVANGRAKAYAIKELIEGEIRKEVPATSLRMHKEEEGVIVIADEEACSLLKKE